MAFGDRPNIIAVDLGAESCRVSLLDWPGSEPRIRLVHRFANQPVPHPDGSLRWPLDTIVAGVHHGLARCAELCARIDAIGVDGWAVDYVRLNAQGAPVDMPYCYRDSRTEAVFARLHASGVHHELFRQTGAQPIRINTLYQLMADEEAGRSRSGRWANLPEYVLGLLCGRFVSEYTNATHTGLLDVKTQRWCAPVFEQCGLRLDAAPELVECGAVLGPLRSSVLTHAAFANTQILAPACHDTASAIAAIGMDGEDWAYISSGTWSLIGVVAAAPVVTPEALADGFTNQGAAGNGVCLHKNVNGMWLLKQTMLQLTPDAAPPLPELVAAASAVTEAEGLLDVDAPELMLPGPMAAAINRQRRLHGLPAIEESAQMLPVFANLIFRSLAERYRTVLQGVERLSGKRLRRLVIAGGGSRNEYLNRLTADTTGLAVECGVAESSTVGNLAVQLATLDGRQNRSDAMHAWAGLLSSAAAAASHSFQ